MLYVGLTFLFFTISTVVLLDALENKYLQFPLCHILGVEKDVVEEEFKNSTSMSCNDEIWCNFCVSVLDENSVYRVSDMIKQSGRFWYKDSKEIVEGEEYKESYLQNMLIKTSKITDDGKVYVGEPMENMVVLKELLDEPRELSEKDTALLNRNDALIVYIRMGDKIDAVPVEEIVLRAKRYQTIVLSFVLHYGAIHVLTKHESNMVSSHASYIRNFDYIRTACMQIKENLPNAEILIRSNKDPDTDIYFYKHVKHLMLCDPHICRQTANRSHFGFERVLEALRSEDESKNGEKYLVEGRETYSEYNHALYKHDIKKSNNETFV